MCSNQIESDIPLHIDLTNFNSKITPTFRIEAILQIFELHKYIKNKATY